MKIINKSLKLLFLTILTILVSAPTFLNENFGELNFDQIMLVLMSGTEGANLEIVIEFIIHYLPYFGVLCMLLLIARVSSHYKFIVKIKLFKQGINKSISFNCLYLINILSLVFAVALSIFYIDSRLDITDYVNSRMNPGYLYENEYVDPKNVNIQFPDQKQNLIYIVLESINTNFTDIKVDGNVVNLIPNLQNIAEDELNFSNTEELGGHIESSGVKITAASLVAQTSGVPLQLPMSVRIYEKQDVFLPGITTLGEILEDNGYSNYYLFGSDGDYAGRKTYFESHGNYTVYDLYYFREIGYIPEDYHVFWGMEDSKLFTFAKEKLEEISKNDKPFNLSMLTVDSHFMDGYTDEVCPLKYDTKYANAISCSDSIVSEFLNWVKEQDFYENTTIIVVGDHNTMNHEFLSQSNDTNYAIYNAMLNVNLEFDSNSLVNRQFTVMDYFPTTLAALGAKIENEKLGLGVNLFSGEETIVERLGLDAFNKEVEKKSLYYERNFLSNLRVSK